MKVILFIFFIGLTFSIHADNYTLPSSCEPLAIKKGALVLSAKKPVLLLIHNLSNTDLWITHPVSDPSASAGWSSRLQASYWSALVLDKESFELNCIESKPGHEQQIPCKEAIVVCKWPTVSLPEKEKGTFWAAENMEMSRLTSHLRERGFGLPDLAK